MTTGKGALDGIRVLDLGRVLAAPFAAQMLADLGADVIKVERPGTGDDARRYGFFGLPDAGGGRSPESSFYLCGNRNKRAITCDIATGEGQEIIRRLAAQADVVIENYKVGDLKRYGLDYDALRPLNPGMIFCSITGYGQTGPDAPLPGFDGLFQAMGGMMAVTGIADGEPGAGPLKAGPSLVDIFTGHNAAAAILAALFHRQRTGEGQYIDMALLDCSVAMTSHIMQDYLVGHIPPPRVGNGGNGGGPADLIRASDGLVYISAGSDRHWRNLCGLMGKPHLIDDPRFATSFLRGKDNRLAAIAEIEMWSMHHSAGELVEMIRSIGCPVARYNELPQVWEEQQVRHRGLKVAVDHPLGASVDLIASPLAGMAATPATIRTPPPTMGQHNKEILRDMLGYSEEMIGELAARKVI
ncbi:CoA transferase [Sphingobium sp. LB126]|nr:CoA transferase [Sphingobium sp. LB126]